MKNLHIAALFAAVVLFGYVTNGRAHGDAAWIMDGHYVDKDGAHCCGPTDCKVEEARFFREAPDGIHVLTKGGEEVLMPRDLVGRGLYPSIDERWWICVRDGKVKCVFKPTTGM